MVEILKKEQAASEVAIEQLAGGGTIRSKRRKVVQHEGTIKRLKTEFTDGIRSLDALFHLFIFNLMFVSTEFNILSSMFFTLM